MSEERVREYWRRVWSDGDVEFALEFYAPRFVQNDRERTSDRFAAGAAGLRLRSHSRPGEPRPTL